MSEKRSQCIKCSAPLDQPPTGRPRRYCSEACRSAAGYEIRRLRRQLEALEIRASHLRVDLHLGRDVRYVDGRPGELLPAIRQEIDRAERRLRALLADGADVIGVEPDRARARRDTQHHRSTGGPGASDG